MFKKNDRVKLKHHQPSFHGDNVLECGAIYTVVRVERGEPPFLVLRDSDGRTINYFYVSTRFEHA